VGTPYLSLSKIEKLHEDPEVAALMQAPLTNDVDASSFFLPTQGVVIYHCTIFKN
jgi:hypothetical protein